MHDRRTSTGGETDGGYLEGVLSGTAAKGRVMVAVRARNAAAAGQEWRTSRLDTTLAYRLSARRVVSSTTPFTTSARKTRSASPRLQSISTGGCLRVTPLKTSAFLLVAR